jgi:Arc/MetJ-type ribon-helix-helix transcriptional regulator
MQTKYRDKPLGMRLSEQEAKVVELVAAETGLSRSDVVRQALRKAYPEKFAAVKDRRPKR